MRFSWGPRGSERGSGRASGSSETRAPPTILAHGPALPSKLVFFPWGGCGEFRLQTARRERNIAEPQRLRGWRPWAPWNLPRARSGCERQTLRSPGSPQAALPSGPGAGRTQRAPGGVSTLRTGFYLWRRPPSASPTPGNSTLTTIHLPASRLNWPPCCSGRWGCPACGLEAPVTADLGGVVGRGLVGIKSGGPPTRKRTEQCLEHSRLYGLRGQHPCRIPSPQAKLGVRSNVSSWKPEVNLLY